MNKIAKFIPFSVITISLIISCNLKEPNVKLPENQFYFPFHHVKEITDDDNKTVKYELLDGTLSTEETKALIEILEARHSDYLVTNENVVLIKKLYISNFVDLSAIDAELERNTQGLKTQ